MHRLAQAGIAACVLLAASCRAQDSAGAGAAAYELVCNAAQTAQQAAVFCLRHDTRRGEVERVDLDRLPKSDGSTGTDALHAPGTFQLVCTATATETRSDLYCVRLDRRTGAMLLVSLPTTPLFPK